MPASARSSMESSLQALIDCAEQGDWGKLDQIAGQLIPALDVVAHSGPAKPADAAAIRQLLLKLQTAIDRCTERKAQIGPLLDALSHKTPSRDSV
jgi:hypothetical protein